jgi:hypothetical protein
MSKQTGNCPSCGAPIYSEPVPGDPKAIPQTVFTCPCHTSLQQPKWVPYYVTPQPYYPIQPFQPQPYAPWSSPTWIQPNAEPWWTFQTYPTLASSGNSMQIWPVEIENK